MRHSFWVDFVRTSAPVLCRAYYWNSQTYKFQIQTSKFSSCDIFAFFTINSELVLPVLHFHLTMSMQEDARAEVRISIYVSLIRWSYDDSMMYVYMYISSSLPFTFCGTRSYFGCWQFPPMTFESSSLRPEALRPVMQLVRPRDLHPLLQLKRGSFIRCFHIFPL